MKSKVEIAVGRFLSGFNCANQYFLPIVMTSTSTRTATLKIACGFGRVWVEKRSPVVQSPVDNGAGANTGSEKGERTATELTYMKTRELMDQFTKKYGTCICRKLLTWL